MLSQFKKIDNESGIVLFIVLMTAIIIMILSLGILTQSLNEINYAQQQIDQISSEQLSKGMWWNAYANGMQNVPSQGVPANVPGSGRAYTMVMGLSSSSAGINSYTISTNYNIF